MKEGPTQQFICKGCKHRKGDRRGMVCKKEDRKLHKEAQHQTPEWCPFLIKERRRLKIEKIEKTL